MERGNVRIPSTTATFSTSSSETKPSPTALPSPAAAAAGRISRCRPEGDDVGATASASPGACHSAHPAVVDHFALSSVPGQAPEARGPG